MRAAFAAEAIKTAPVDEHRLRRLGIQREMRWLWRPWVARLDGPCPRYGYRRRFLRPYIDYTEANSAGTRGVIYRWILDAGQFYEARYPAALRRMEHRFVTVTAAGEVVDVDEIRIRAAWEEQETRQQWENVPSEWTS